jgi:hypothetical protein
MTTSFRGRKDDVSGDDLSFFSPLRHLNGIKYDTAVKVIHWLRPLLLGLCGESQPFLTQGEKRRLARGWFG